MELTLCISPHGRLFLSPSPDDAPSDGASSTRIQEAFVSGQAQGLLHLATRQLGSTLPPALSFARDFGSRYLTRLCHTPELEGASELPPVPIPNDEELTAVAMGAPPMRGLEYLNGSTLAAWWSDLDELVRGEVRTSAQSVQEYLRELNPVLRTVGRVTFHLAENKRDPEHPFAFPATYATRLSAQGRAQHQPLGRAMQEYAGAQNRSALLALLQPIQRSGARREWIKELADSGDVYHPLAWTPREAYRFLQDIPEMEAAGLIVHVPDWWKAARPPRPVVSVKVGERRIDGGDKGIEPVFVPAIRVRRPVLFAPVEELINDDDDKPLGFGLSDNRGGRLCHQPGASRVCQSASRPDFRHIHWVWFRRFDDRH